MLQTVTRRDSHADPTNRKSSIPSAALFALAAKTDPNSEGLWLPLTLHYKGHGCRDGISDPSLATGSFFPTSGTGAGEIF